MEAQRWMVTGNVNYSRGGRLLTVVLGLLLAIPAGCGPSVETSPSKILPVLKQAQRCCDGRCSGQYQGVSQNVACADVAQMESCLAGERAECPVKGEGAF
jgi:hypothetical protein